MIIVYAIGFLAQGFFSARILVQWILSERAKQLVSPTLYWVFSLIGSYLLFVYGWCRDDFSIIFGQIISYYIYLWNLDAKGIWKPLPKILRIILVATPVIAIIALMHDVPKFIEDFLRNEKIPLWMVIFGSTGQLIFTLRFVYQWFYSKRQHMSSLPVNFWIISITGSAIIVAYGIFRHDPVLILGQSVGFIAYTRNIIIGVRAKKSTEPHQ
jgi:lipid-A-disaccharide synthase-like uncharacterized protein